MKKLTTLALLLSLTFSSLNALAAPQKANGDLNADVYLFTKAEQSKLREIESKLNQITTLKSKFRQTTSDGGDVTGTFYLSRPGKMRINYDPPVKNFIVATGTFLVYWDDEMQQQSHTSIGSSLADIFLRKKIKFGERLKLSAFMSKDDLYMVSLSDRENLDQGTITLFLDKKSLNLKQWSIEDPMGKLTTVELHDPHYSVALDKSLFQFSKPTQ